MNLKGKIIVIATYLGLGLFVSLAFIGTSKPAKAGNAPVHECDRLAAHKNDKSAVVKGLPWKDLNAYKAISACKKAVNTYPGVTRFQFQYGRALDKAKQYGEAVKWYRKAADQGYAVSQYNLGVTYRNGEGVTKNMKEAVKWYRKAADQGHVYAQYSLALSYDDGIGVAKNKKEAAKWYRKAADQGHAKAQWLLGEKYYSGEGFARDYRQAFKWFSKSAEQGNAEGQNWLGIMYYNGEGVPKDRNKGIALFKKAAAGGNKKAVNNLVAVEKNLQRKRAHDKAVKDNEWVSCSDDGGITTYDCQRSQRGY